MRGSSGLHRGRQKYRIGGSWHDAQPRRTFGRSCDRPNLPIVVALFPDL